MVGPVDVAAAVQALESEGFFTGLFVRPGLVKESASFWSEKGPGVYVDADLHSPALAEVAKDPGVLEVVRRYFGSEPIQIECKLFVSEVHRMDLLTSGFHFDHAGVRSLNVMVYLTPVDRDSGPHVLVAGTHRRKLFKDYFRELTSIEEIERRFPQEIRTITGPAGMVLIENAEIFHRRLVARRPRVAMIIVFSTNRRRLLSIGKDRRSDPIYGAASEPT